MAPGARKEKKMKIHVGNGSGLEVEKGGVVAALLEVSNGTLAWALAQPNPTQFLTEPWAVIVAALGLCDEPSDLNPPIRDFGNHWEDGSKWAVREE